MLFPITLPLRSITLCGALLLGMRSWAQCVSVFPYTEDFEAAPAWTAGGSGSDWAWGTPSKPVITGPGGGNNSWCVGGLTGSFYSLGQSSWLESPCFDFTNVPNPWISFKVFWETERQYDGANLQYSLNGGTSWTNVGAFGNPVDCLNDNWYNYATITNLSGATPKHGWSGRVGATVGACVGGFGSQQWVDAKHCLLGCAGQPNVLLRFLFGSGTTCNNYDGVAVDDIFIDQAPISVDASALPCTGDTVNFTSAIVGCGNITAWDFGDPASGAANSSTLPAPMHVFSGPGAYQVTITVSGPCGISVSDVVDVLILDVALNIMEPQCAGDIGSGIVTINGPQNQPSITWLPGGQTGLQFGTLPAGSYSVVVSDVGACTTTIPFTVNEPPPLTLLMSNDTAICSGDAVLLQATPSGGTAGYNVAWAPTGPAVSPSVISTFTATATDANGCISPPDSVTVTVFPPVQPQFSNSAPEGCEPWCVTFTDDTPGAATSDWSFGDGSVGGGSPAQHCYVEDGLYTVVLTTTDANGCSGTLTQTDLVNVFASPVADFQAYPPITIITNPSFLFLDGSSGASQWSWTMGDPDSSTSTEVSPGFTYADVGCYTVEQIVGNTEGCYDTTSVEVCVEGEFALYVPNAFTPDGDGINDGFLPITSVRQPSLFEFNIFDRWGQPIFSSGAVDQAWDGKQTGIETPQGVYAWRLRLRDSENQVHSAQGHVVLLR